MGTLFTQVKEALVRLDELQASHINAFDSQILPDLENQILQRKEGFSDLQNSISEFMCQTAAMDMADTQPMIQHVQDSLLSLMNQNKTLHSKIEAHKTHLENSMKHLNRGRQVIHAYGSSQHNHPKVITTRN